MTDTLTRVRQLVELAGSPYEQEARTSAYLACKLIREHGFRLVDAKEEPRHAPMRDAEHYAEDPPYMAGGACRAVARYAVTCRDCGALIAEGSRMWWRRGVGGVHARCNANVLY